MTATPLSAPAAAKRVLLVRFSQTGQLDAVTDAIAAPLEAEPRISVRVESLRPARPFPFPWPLLEFFDAFPEAAHLRGCTLAPLTLKGDEAFDLVILAWQVWFLAPSLPTTAFLRHPVAAQLLDGKPVVSVIVCRNMWLAAHEKFKTLLAACGPRLVDNVVLTDPGPTFATFFTTPAWLLFGRKRGFWGMPDAGLTQAQIEGSRRFGRALAEALAQDRERGTAPLLAGLGAVTAEPRLWFGEQAGTRSFYLWGKLIMAVGPPGSRRRRPLLALYVVFLLALIVTVLPLSLALQALLRPLFRARLTKMKARFEHPSGSATDRCHVYDD